jgi:hypothetical protein
MLSKLYSLGRLHNASQEFLGISIARSMTVRATRYCEVSTLNPLDIEDVLDVHIGLKRRLQRYGVLKQDMEKMMESHTVDEVAVERMKQQIEDTFEDTEEMELRGMDPHSASVHRWAAASSAYTLY